MLTNNKGDFAEKAMALLLIVIAGLAAFTLLGRNVANTAGNVANNL